MVVCITIKCMGYVTDTHIGNKCWLVEYGGSKDLYGAIPMSASGASHYECHGRRRAFPEIGDPAQWTSTIVKVQTISGTLSSAASTHLSSGDAINGMKNPANAVTGSPTHEKSLYKVGGARDGEGWVKCQTQCLDNKDPTEARPDPSKTYEQTRNTLVSTVHGHYLGGRGMKNVGYRFFSGAAHDPAKAPSGPQYLHSDRGHPLRDDSDLASILTDAADLERQRRYALDGSSNMNVNGLLYPHYPAFQEISTSVAGQGFFSSRPSLSIGSRHRKNSKPF